MDPDRWQRLQALFHEAVALPEEARRTYLEGACGDDPTLMAEVVAMVERDRASTHLLDRSLSGMARGVLGGPASAPGSVGPYRIVEVLGEGGMGVVFLAEREDLGSRVAIKMLRDALLSPVRRERFANEQRTLARLNHPSIARLYDADSLPDGTPYFVMEYVQGQRLTDHCAAAGASLAERLRLFREVCGAVQYAHSHAIIHRDLKPSNVLVTPDGTVKLLDFGIARQLETVDAAPAATRTEFRAMTPAYAAPEQIRGEAVGVYTDVYALGVVLYELLAGRPPFELSKRTPGEVERAVTEDPVERPSAWARREAGKGARGVPDPAAAGRHGWSDLDVLCLTAMHRDPARRYRTVEALVRDLDHYLRGEPLEARPDSLGYRAGKFLRRNRRPVAAAGVVAATIVGLAAFHTARLAEERTVARAEAAKARAVSEFLIGLFEAADPLGATPDDLDVLALLARGVERAEALADQPAVHAQMLDILGRVHLDLSQYDRAEPLIRRALSLRSEPGWDPVELAQSLGNLGRLHAHRSRNDSADAYLGQALALRERHLTPTDPELAINLNDLGTVLTASGQYDRAEALYRRALEILRNGSDDQVEEVGRTLHNLAVNFFNRGDHAAAEPYYREALSVDSAALGPDHPRVAMELASLALVLESRGELDAAEAILGEALRIRRLKLGDQHVLTSFGMVQMGGLLRKKGENLRAGGYLREAVDINTAMLGAEHPQTALAMHQLALTLRDEGEPAAAEPLVAHAAGVFRRAFGERHYYVGASLCDLGHVLSMTGRGEEGFSHFRDGLAALEAAVPGNNPSITLCQDRFGRALLEGNHPEEAEPLLRAVHEKMRATRGEGHPETRDAAMRLHDVYELLGRTGDAARIRDELEATRELPEEPAPSPR